MTALNWIRRIESFRLPRLYASLFLIAFAVRAPFMLAIDSYRHPEHSTDTRGPLMRMRPYNGGPPLARYLALGEVQFNAEQKEEAMRWMFRHPREFALLTAQRIYYFWICPLKPPNRWRPGR